MDYTEPLFAAEDDPYLDADPGTGFEGSFIPAASVEARMRELVHLIAFSGQAPSRVDREQVRRAMQAVIANGIAPYSGLALSLGVVAAQFISGVLGVQRMPPALEARNFLLNGQMNIWQRGHNATFVVGTDAANGVPYTADRWAALRTGSGATYTVKRAAYTGSFPNCLRMQRAAGSTEVHVAQLFQVLTIEDSRPLSGRTVTLAFRARKGANFSGAWLGSRVRAGFRTGTEDSLAAFAAGAALGYTTLDTADHAITTSDESYTRTFAVPAGVQQLAVELRWIPTGTAGAADYVEVTGVRLQPGLEAFALSQGSVVKELRECQRFYNKTFDYEVQPARDTGLTGGALASSSTNASGRDCHVTWRLPVEMRATPSVTLYNPIANNANWGEPDSDESWTSVITSIGRRMISVGNVPGIPEHSRIAIHVTASAEL